MASQIIYKAAAQTLVGLIVAMGLDRAIGERGTMPWYLPDDLKHFKAKTLNSCVIMGRRTFESIGRPLPQRRNIVITSSAELRSQYPQLEFASSLNAALELARGAQPCPAVTAGETEGESEVEVREYSKIMIIGGAGLFAEVAPIADVLELTEIRARFPNADTFFPLVDMTKIGTTISFDPPMLEGRASYYVCQAKQPEGFAQVVPSLDLTKESLLDSSLHEIADDELLDKVVSGGNDGRVGEALCYRYVTITRS